MNGQNDVGVATDRVLTAQEGVEAKSRIAGRRDSRQWHWMGNYGDPVDAVTVANSPPACLSGDVVFSVNGNLVPAWMFY
ncbi:MULTISPECIES: hypothetical protein [Streptomyces]|uniref:Uncharacterized protein n=2 Tax=Streptomyces TaxID=1883 RepID=A0A646KAL6_STRJU|nr:MULTISPECIES: hypothetical protein [Streptomyces]MQS36321.1 hypothetical protein [Streptomyces katsurahamanus]MQS99213.1 hypothetical protein [Streptomyces jumonjinensis]